MTDGGFREAARRRVDSLPDDATRDDLMHAIHVRRQLEAGMADIAAARVRSVEDVRERFGIPR